MHLEQISFRYLVTLCVLHETGSMRKTADVLGRTPPAISLQIKALENIVGFDIVEHVRGHFAFTRQGMQLARQAKYMVADMNQMIQEVASETEDNIRLGITEDFFRRGMKDIATLLDAEWIDVCVECSEDLLTKFRNGKLDIVIAKAFSPVQGSTKSWRHQPAWAGQTGPIRGDRSLDLVLLSQGCLYHQAALRACSTSDRSYSIRSVCSSWDTVFRSLVRGGLTVVSRDWPGEAALCEDDIGLPKLPEATVNLLLNQVGNTRRRDECEQLAASIVGKLGLPEGQRLI